MKYEVGKPVKVPGKASKSSEIFIMDENRP